MSAPSATPAPENAHPEPVGAPQPFLPFAGDELLHVRVRQVDFARMLAVDKATVCRWIRKGVITLGADGRLDPQRAMQQLLRSGDPGRIRARLVRQAFADMGDLRAQASRADQLEAELYELRAKASAQGARDDADYQRLSNWLDSFEARVAAIPQDERAGLDGLSWRSHIRGILLGVMNAPDEETFAEITAQIEADLGRAFVFNAEGVGA